MCFAFNSYQDLSNSRQNWRQWQIWGTGLAGTLLPIFVSDEKNVFIVKQLCFKPPTFCLATSPYKNEGRVWKGRSESQWLKYR